MAEDSTSGGSTGGSSGGANFAEDAANRIRDAGQQARDAFSERVVEPAKRAGEAMRQGGQKVVETNQAIGVKMIDQAEQNARQAFDAMRKAAQATDLSSVMQIQGEYLREQSQRSMTQAREIGELIVQFGRDAVTSMRSGSGGTGGEPRRGGE